MPIVLKMKWSSGPGFTVNVFDVPVLVEVAVIESVPEVFRVIDCDARTPAVKAPEVVGDIPPSRFDRVTVETKDVTVLLFTSCATIFILKGTPAVWVAMFAPEVLVTAK